VPNDAEDKLAHVRAEHNPWQQKGRARNASGKISTAGSWLGCEADPHVPIPPAINEVVHSRQKADRRFRAAVYFIDRRIA
jgi:hypothetical protein